MNKSNRFCRIQGDFAYSVFYICTLHDSKQTTRWCCLECLRKRIHHHNQNDYIHLMNKEEILNKVKMDQKKTQKEYLDKQSINQQNFLEVILIECQKIEKCLMDYMRYIEQIQNIISEEDQANLNKFMFSQPQQL